MPSYFRKILVLIILIGLFVGCEKTKEEEIVHIPDSAFQNALIANDVDRDSDGLISYPEAEATETLLIPPSGIKDLTGLEAFVNLDSLTITLNPLSGIDLSGNSVLRYLKCIYCELTSVDISNNLLLEELILSRNLLSEIDISHNQSLTRLSIKNNLLTSLDLSANSGLTTMISCGNQLRRLDISMHPSLTLIGVDNMPMLNEVCVWTLPFPPEGIIVLQAYSPYIQYTTNCSR
jgi:hypothetical protein